ncbi:hypothetical protein TSUD_22100 [Trifolium subterraneum]|uniref:Uncharacterized protein n=1 Tax=Trifolium subterraneum TaxID=3900 RepID=A0A2Z6MGS4_TRISU|nr:hypothetical protein TSUD_22100 [Trifolium subterraneum]
MATNEQLHKESEEKRDQVKTYYYKIQFEKQSPVFLAISSLGLVFGLYHLVCGIEAATNSEDIEVSPLVAKTMGLRWCLMRADQHHLRNINMLLLLI